MTQKEAKQGSQLDYVNEVHCSANDFLFSIRYYLRILSMSRRLISKNRHIEEFVWEHLRTFYFSRYSPTIHSMQFLPEHSSHTALLAFYFN